MNILTQLVIEVARECWTKSMGFSCLQRLQAWSLSFFEWELLSQNLRYFRGAVSRNLLYYQQGAPIACYQESFMVTINWSDYQYCSGPLSCILWQLPYLLTDIDRASISLLTFNTSFRLTISSQCFHSFPQEKHESLWTWTKVQKRMVYHQRVN